MVTILASSTRKKKIIKENYEMLTLKRFFILMVTAMIAVTGAMGQNSAGGEESMQEQMELAIIRETSHAASREQKLLALEYIGSAIDRGVTSTDIHSTLEYLAMEGFMNKISRGGRIINNFPDVRREAARHLGYLRTEEAKTILLRICRTDNEPMVLQEAIKSLGDIESKEDGDTIDTIVRVAQHYDNTTAPQNLLMLAVIDSLDKIATRKRGITNPGALQILLKITDGPYDKGVRLRAERVIKKFRLNPVRDQ
jgi:hypothetical protein